MNAFLPTLDTANIANYNNYMSFGLTRPIQNTFASPLFNFNGANSQSAIEDTFKKYDILVDRGIISEKQAEKKIREIFGFAASEDELTPEEKLQSASALSGKVLKEARTSNEGAFAINETQAQVAQSYLDGAKAILKKEQSAITKNDIAQLNNIFEEVSKNPMVAEAFMTEANTASFRGPESKTTTLMGSYQQALTKFYGKEEAEKLTNEKLKDFESCVIGRNSEEVNKFQERYNKDKTSIEEYNFFSKIQKNFGKHPVVGILGAAGASTGVWAGFKIVANSFKNQGLIAGAIKSLKSPVGLGILAVGTTTYAAYNLLKD